MGQQVLTARRVRYAVFVQTGNGESAWFIKGALGDDEFSAIKNSRVRTTRGDYCVRAFPEGSAEAKAAYRKVGAKLPAGVFTQ